MSPVRHPVARPKLLDRGLPRRLRELEHAAAAAVRRRDEQQVVVAPDRGRDVEPVARPVRVVPQQLPVAGIEARDAFRVEQGDLVLAVRAAGGRVERYDDFRVGAAHQSADDRAHHALRRPVLREQRRAVRGDGRVPFAEGPAPDLARPRGRPRGQAAGRDLEVPGRPAPLGPARRRLRHRAGGREDPRERQSKILHLRASRPREDCISAVRDGAGRPRGAAAGRKRPPSSRCASPPPP